MKGRKPSFLEHLTGSRAIAEDELDETEEEPRIITHPHTQFATHETEDNEESAATQLMDEPERTYEKDEDDPEDDEDDRPGLAIDMYEVDNEIVIQCMIAGVMPENLHISITRKTVTLEGKRNEPEGIDEEQYTTRELYWGPFYREIELPHEIDPDNAEAVERYGLLIIRLPKFDTKRIQEIKVKSL